MRKQDDRLKTEELYNRKPSHFKNMKFYDAIKERIKLAKELRKHLVEHDFYSKRRRDVTDAISWNEKVLEELQEEERREPKK